MKGVLYNTLLMKTILYLMSFNKYNGKYAGVDRLVETLIAKLGDANEANIDQYHAQGIDSGLPDIILIGKINKAELEDC